MNEVTRPAGRVVEIWRYPVAGLMGERLEHARLDATGLEGDRAGSVVRVGVIQLGDPADPVSR